MKFQKVSYDTHSISVKFFMLNCLEYFYKPVYVRPYEHELNVYAFMFPYHKRRTSERDRVTYMQ